MRAKQSFFLTLITMPLLAFAANIAPAKPNIVVILVDDMGFGDLSLNGREEWQTPHIDRLSEQGMNFSAATVTAPQCGPSRAGLISGVYQQRIHMASNRQIHCGNSFPEEMKTFAEYMVDGGYRTGMVGKWHLGHKKGQTPNDRGFEYFCLFTDFGIQSGMSLLSGSVPLAGVWGRQ